MYSLTFQTPAEDEPVSLAEAKVQLRVDGTDENALIETLITAAREKAEARLGRALMPQTWKLVLPRFPAGDRFASYIELQRPPFILLISLVYVDPDGNNVTMDAAEYTISEGSIFSYVRPAYGSVWPVTRDCEDAVTLTYQAGYANAAAVPESIKSWMKNYIATLYENREGLADKKALPRNYVDGLLDSYIVPVV